MRSLARSALLRLGLDAQILVLAGARFFEAVAAGIIIPILPGFLVDLEPGRFAGLSEATRTGLVFSIFGGVTTVGQYVFGGLADRTGRYKAGVLVSIAAFAILAWSLPAIRTFPALLVVRVLQGMALGLAIPCIWSILTAAAPESRRGAAVGFYSSVQMLGLAIGPLLGGLLATSFSIPAAFRTCAGLGALTFLLVSLFVREPARRTAPAPAGGRLAGALPFLALSAAVFACLFATTMVVSYFPSYEVELGASELDLSYVFAATVFARLLFQYPFGSLSDRYGRRPFLIGGLLAMAPLSIAMGFAARVWHLVALRGLLGAAMAAVIAPAYALAGDRSEPGRRGRQMGLVSMGFTAGVTVGPIVAGVGLEVGHVFPWLLGGALAAATAVLVLVAVREADGS